MEKNSTRRWLRHERFYTFPLSLANDSIYANADIYLNISKLDASRRSSSGLMDKGAGLVITFNVRMWCWEGHPTSCAPVLH